MPTLPHISQLFKQCQNCFKSEAEVHLKCCTNCKSAHYCSQECQRAKWKQHKPECRATMEKRELIMKQAQSPTPVGVVPTKADADATKIWVQLFRPLLSVTVTKALAIQQDSARVLTHILNITLRPNFTAGNTPKTTKALKFAFKFQNAFVTSIEEILVAKPECREQMEGILQMSRKLRAQSPRAVGLGLIMLLIPACGIGRVVPLGVTENNGLRVDEQWEAQLAQSDSP